MTKYFLLLFFILTLTFSLHAQNRMEEDFSMWGWIQIEKKTFNKEYFSFQYQVRYNENASKFNRSNLYFIYGFDEIRRMNIEVLYQLNTNYKGDQHTFYIGDTYKVKFSQRFHCYLRTAVQHTRNHFTGDYKADKPSTVWRNRVRLGVNLNPVFSLTASSEPYFLIDEMHPMYLSRIRYVYQFNFKYNKFNNIAIYYLNDDDIFSYSKKKSNNVLGLTYSIILPNKLKKIKDMFDPKFLNNFGNPSNSDPSDSKDTFN